MVVLNMFEIKRDVHFCVLSYGGFRGNLSGKALPEPFVPLVLGNGSICFDLFPQFPFMV